MSAILAAAALGSAAISGIGSRRKDKEAESGREDAVGAINKGIGKIDDFSSIANDFAAAGENSFLRYEEMIQPIEKTLNDYYMNLNPDELAARGNQTAQQQFQTAQDQAYSDLASKNMLDAGAKAQLDMGYGNQMATTKYQNIMDSSHDVANMQSGWYGNVANQKNQAANMYGQGVNQQANVSNMYNNAYGNMANVYSGQATQASNMAQEGRQGVGSGTMAAAYFYGKD